MNEIIDISSMSNDNKLGWIWWIILFIISVGNTTYITKHYAINDLSPFEKKITLFAITYALICTVRTTFPKKDLARTCFFDTRLSYPLFGRAIATIAELCFTKLLVSIFGKIFNDINKQQNNLSKISSKLIKIIFPTIILAQIFSWMGCLTKNNLWNATEESLWTFSFLILLVISISTYNNMFLLENTTKNESIKTFLLYFIFASVIYIGFMMWVDIPMYLNRSKKYKHPKKKISLLGYVKDMAQCKKVTKSYNDWKDDMPWLTGYFTFAVWSSILMVKWYYNYKRI